MDRTRFIIAGILSLIVLIGWPVVSNKFFPEPPAPQVPITQESGQPATQPPTGPVPQPAQTSNTQSPPPSSTVQVPQREILIRSPFWEARFSNRGAVAVSWILKKERKRDGSERPLLGADGQSLELIPQHGLDIAGAPLGLRVPSSPDLTKRVNDVTYQIHGVDANQATVDLAAAESNQITFNYSSPDLTVTKTFTFHADQPILDASVKVTAGGSSPLTELVIGPRIGDQSDRQTGSYSSPPQVVAYNSEDKVERLLGAKITPPFTKIKSVDESSKQIEIETPLAGDVDEIRLVASDGTTFLGWARVVGREAGNHWLTLDSLPPGIVAGDRVAQGTDTLRRVYLWSGMVSRYFAMVAVPSVPAREITLTNVQLKPEDKSQPPLEFPSVAMPVQPDSTTRIFIGPKDRELLSQVGAQLNANLDPLIDYGFFHFLIQPLVPAIAWALSNSAKLVHNYGWGIVLVTVAINLLLSPLRLQSSKKMKSAAKHQPRIKELQERMKKLKENPKKYEREIEQLQKEQVALMKEANPLGGCLPMLLQMPIFWAFYIYLTISLDVRHEPWVLWIKDLSTADPYKILPIVMCVSMIGSSMLQPQPATADPSQRTQRIMMTWLMPIVLTWLFFFSAPSGLVLYWMVSNLVGVAIQFAINRRTAEPAVAVEKPKDRESTKPTSSGSQPKEPEQTKSAKKRDKAEAARKRKMAEKEIVGGVR